MNGSESVPAVRLERVIPAPPHQVYRAWLEPELLRQWMAPGDFELSRAEVDERVGGHYRIWHAAGGTEAGGFEAELLELVPDQRIAWRWGFAGPQRRNGPVYDSQLTVTLAGDSGGRHRAHAGAHAAGRPGRGDAGRGRAGGPGLGRRAGQAGRHGPGRRCARSAGDPRARPAAAGPGNQAGGAAWLPGAASATRSGRRRRRPASSRSCPRRPGIRGAGARCSGPRPRSGSAPPCSRPHRSPRSHRCCG